MAANDGQASLGVTIVGDDTITTELGDIMTLSGPDMTGTDVEVTQLSETLKTFVPGRVDLGDVTMGIRYAKANSNDLLQEIVGGATVQGWTVTFPDSTTLSFEGFLTGWNMDFPDNSSIDGEITIAVTGDSDPAFA